MRRTVYGMIAVGLLFWLAAIVIPGYQVWMIVASAVLVAWSCFWLMTDDSPIQNRDPDDRH